MPPSQPFLEGGLVFPSPALRAAVAIVGDRDPTFRQIEARCSSLTVRQWTPGFASLVRIVLGQQLSTKAAQAIYARLTQHSGLTPTHLMDIPEATLKQIGLSRAKIATCQRLAVALLDQQIDLERLVHLDDQGAIAHLTSIKGIGVWTAEVYLLFCLQRLSILPASDLALQIGFQGLKHLESRPTRQTLLAQTASLHPYGGAVAHLLWHYYRHTRSAKKAPPGSQKSNLPFLAADSPGACDG